ncbi:hypothetical protein [Qipengyuania sp. NPDC077563]|uniref:hypothetical protein n=1 Tax=Qipengyuania sp. NPDC077563 TaxID=3364497 RepID=UPI00384B413C
MKETQHQDGDTPPSLEGAAPLRPRSFSAEELAELERRERLGGWLILFFAGAALATGALAFYLFADDVEQNDEFVRADRPAQTVQPAAEEEEPFLWGGVLPEPKEEAEPEAEEPPAPPTGKAQAPTGARNSETPVQTFNFPGPPEPGDTPRFSGPRPGSVDRETSRALRSGEAELWREDGQRGYVLVSDAVVYGDRECRQVSYTLFADGGQRTSPSSQWCRTRGSARWRPDPRGAE